LRFKKNKNMARAKGGYGFLIKWLVALGDLMILNVLFYTVYRWTHLYFGESFNVQTEVMFLLLNFSYMFAVYFTPIQIYKPVIHFDKVVQHALSMIAMHALFFVACMFFLKMSGDKLPVYFLLYYYGMLFGIFTCWRILVRLLLKRYRSRGRNYRQVIIVGAGKNGLTLYEEMKDLTYGYKVLGFFDDNLSLKTTLPEYLGKTSEVEDFVMANKVDEIYCTLPNSQDEKITRLLQFSEKNMVRFYLIPEFSRYVKRRLMMENIASLPILAVREEPLQSFGNRLVKRAFDILFSLLFLCTLFPFIYLISAILIKFSSKGAVIFAQERTGFYGEHFKCYKFRSMRENQEANEKQAEKDDPRITRIGQFMRHNNIDELPQFFNVLKGDMSVVGPRPHMLAHTKLYATAIDKYMVRHLVKPGITGWAQVNGYRGETKTLEQMENRVRYDVWYIENWTFLLDLKIIFVTLFNMLKGEKNAY
jgi:putative colanic acid biosynthesis UDP-glucose lipid carrier transferase